MAISIKTESEISIMAEGGKILAEIIQKLKEAVKPGIATKELDYLSLDLCRSYHVKPAFLGYGGFPASVCISINNEVVHGVPSERILNEGDLVSIDMGVVHKSFITDSAVTLPVLGEMTMEDWAKKYPDRNKLIKVTEESMYAGIKQMRPGNRLGIVSYTVQSVADKNSLGVVRDLVGHGVGRKLHEEPYLPNYGSPDDGPILKEGMVLAIEPMLTLGGWQVKIASDNFTFETKDGSLSAHFEHTVAITAQGPKILTNYNNKI